MKIKIMIKSVETNTKTNYKPKLKKNAMDQVNLELEFKKDPKYKTEMCKSWGTKGFCVYGNKCRFAHGKTELFDKSNNNTKYKQKQCLSFHQNGLCLYGMRCHFKHQENCISNIRRSYYSYLLEIYHLNNDITSLNNTGVFEFNHCSDSPDINFFKYGNIMNSCFSSGSLSTTSNDSLNMIPVKGAYGKRLIVFSEIASKSSKKSLNDSFEGQNSSVSVFNFGQALVSSQ